MIVLETYIFLKGRQDNKWCSLKKFDFSNKTNKVGRREYYNLGWASQRRRRRRWSCGGDSNGNVVATTTTETNWRRQQREHELVSYREIIRSEKWNLIFFFFVSVRYNIFGQNPIRILVWTEWSGMDRYLNKNET